MGPLNSKPHLEKVLRYINYALEDGGQVLCGQGIESCDLPSQNKEVKLAVGMLSNYIISCHQQYHFICNKSKGSTSRIRSWITYFDVCQNFKENTIYS